ncbi:uncharacterized protein LOC144882099 [Branchiostoma floridae x Branchiostoma japonicum]
MPSPMLMAISETPRTADSHNPLSEEHTQNPKFLTSLKRDLANEDLSIEERLKIWKLKKELEEKELDTIYKHQEKEVKSLKEAQTFLSRKSLETMYKEIQAKVEEERAKVVRVYEDCLILFLDFETKSDFEHFWGSYTSGRLSDTLSRVITTEEMTRLDNLDKLVHVTRTVVLKEDYRAWRDFFSKGLDRATSADNLLALPPPARHVHCSSLSGLDLAMVATENLTCATGDISTLNFTVKQVQKALQTCKERAEQQVRQKEVQLETIRGQVGTAREDTEAMVRSLTREITRLREKDEKAQKILLEQKLEIMQLQEYGKAKEAEIEELKAENTKLSNQVADIPELRDEVRKFREKDESSQKGLSELRQEMQQMQDAVKTREARIEELTAENSKLSKQVVERHGQLQRLKEEEETQQLPESNKGDAVAQAEDQKSAKHTVEEKSQGDELMLEETQSGAEDKANDQTIKATPPTPEQQQQTQGDLTFEEALQGAQQDGQLPQWQGPGDQQDFINQLIQNTTAKSEYNRLCKARLRIQYAIERLGKEHRLQAVYHPQVVVPVAGQVYNRFLEYYRQHNNTMPMTSYLKAVQERNQALEERAQALEERAQVLEERAQLLEERAQAIQERAQALEERNQARQELDQALHELSQSTQENDDALQQNALFMQEKAEQEQLLQDVQLMQEREEFLQETLKAEALHIKEERDQALQQKARAEQMLERVKRELFKG